MTGREQQSLTPPPPPHSLQGRLPPSRGRPSDQGGRGRQTPRPSVSRVHLPPVTPSAPAPTAARASASFPRGHGDLSESFSRLSRSRRGAAQRDAREAEVAPPAARGASAASEHERPPPVSRGTLTSRGQVTSGRRREAQSVGEHRAVQTGESVL